MGDLEQIEQNWPQFIKGGKNKKLDFVENTDNHFRILQVVSSLANTNGGDLLIGVNHKLKIVGVSPQDVTSELESLLKENNLIHRVQFQTLYISHYAIVRVIVMKSEDKVSVFEGGKKTFYFRVGDNIVQANKVILQFWRMQKKSSIVKCLEENMNILSFILENKSPLTLSKLYKESLLSNKEIDKSIACLLYKNRVEVVLNDGKVSFKSKKKI